MGTSQSSNGPGSCVPMVPPWADDLPDTENPPLDDSKAPEEADSNPEENSEPAKSEKIPMGSPYRWRSTRRALGDFAKTGDRTYLKRGVSKYTSGGYGGGSTATRRLAGTVGNAGKLYGILSGARDKRYQDHRDKLDVRSLAGKKTREIMSAIIEAVQPINGTLDAEASRRAIQEAFSELLEQYPDADLLNLSQDQIVFTLEKYISIDIFNRFKLDVGKCIIDKAPNAIAAMSRMKDAKDYIKQGVSASFRQIKNVAKDISKQGVQKVVQRVLLATFKVFEEYVK